MRSARGLLAVLALSLSSCAAPQGASPPKAGARPSVILITFDTMRADFLGCYGNRVTRTPTLDRLAAQGAVFDRAYAAVPFTPPSLWSLLHSEYVHDYDYGSVLEQGAGPGSLAERFRRAGYLTMGLVGSSQLARAAGFAAGFSVYLDTYHEPSFGNETTLERALELRGQLKEARRKGTPYFLYIHFFDPHSPWGDAPAAFRSYPAEPGAFASVARRTGVYRRQEDFETAKTDQAVRTYSGRADTGALKRDGEYESLMVPMYRSEISWSDDVLRRLLEAYERDGLLENAVQVVSSDHGLAFAEHYQVGGYGFSLFDEVLRVPLLVKGPGVPVRRVPLPVSLVDVGPTLLDLAGIATRHAEGTSLRPLIEGSRRGHPVFAQALALRPEYEFIIFRDERRRYASGTANSQACLLLDRLKLISMPARRGERYEMFDLAADPAEKTDVFRADDRDHAALAQQLRSWRERGARTPGAAADPAALDRLRALGYVR